MQLTCYKCKTNPLLPTKLDNTLPALACNTCHGAYLDLLNYRVWLENNPINPEKVSNAAESMNIEQLDNSENALVCQRCNKFMVKYRINNEQDNTINVCHTCDDVWLDAGEWELLKYLNIQNKLTDIMGEPWQRQLREKEQAQTFTKLYQNKLGEDFETVEKFGEWLNDKDNKSEILHYLSQR